MEARIGYSKNTSASARIPTLYSFGEWALVAEWALANRVQAKTRHAQFEGASDSLQKSFAALMLGYLHGDAVTMAPVVDTYGIKLTNVNEYARNVMAQAATP